VLRKIFGHKKNEVKWMVSDIAVACMGETRNANKIFVGKPEGKRPLQKLGADGKIILEWMSEKWGEKLWTGHVVQDRNQWPALVNTVMNLWVP
jgi:hypothetical protein